MDNMVIDLHLDPEVKAGMESACRKAGISIRAAFSMFAAKVCHDGKIPDEITDDSDDGFYSPENMKALERSLNQLKEGKVVVKTMEELEAMARDGESDIH